MDNEEEYDDETKYLWMGRGQHWQYIYHLNDGVPSRGTGGPPPTPSRVGGVKVTGSDHRRHEAHSGWQVPVQYIDHLNNGVPSRGTGGPPPTPSRVGGVNLTGTDHWH